jgi:hypothetical protein
MRMREQFPATKRRRSHFGKRASEHPETMNEFVSAFDCTCNVEAIYLKSFCGKTLKQERSEDLRIPFLSDTQVEHACAICRQ